MLTQDRGDFRFGEEIEAELKGISERQKLYPVEWESQVSNASEK